MKHKLTKRDILTIPNALSLFRILLIPLIVWLYVSRGQRYAAVGLVVLSGLTDIADGYIARHFNMVSDVGKILDPIADKLTQAAILLCLASRYPVIYWVIALLCMKELLQGLLGLAAIRLTGQVQGALWYGKVSTGVFYGTMLLLLLFADMPEAWAYALIALCAAAFVMAMLLYVRYYLNLLWGYMFQGQNRGSVWLQIFMVIMWAAVIAFCFLHRDSVTIDGILRVTPRSTVLAVLFMLLLFAMKSLSVVIYCGVLYAASGILFPLPLAITVNLIGTGVMAAVPYVLGRHMGNASLEGMVSSHKNAAVLQHLRLENTFLYTTLIRIINVLPFDIMSAYFGATQTRFVPYLLGSVLGMISSCVLFPILGTNITDPRSPQFLISAAIELVIMVTSFLLLVYVRRKAAAEEETA